MKAPSFSARTLAVFCSPQFPARTGFLDASRLSGQIPGPSRRRLCPGPAAGSAGPGPWHQRRRRRRRLPAPDLSGRPPVAVDRRGCGRRLRFLPVTGLGSGRRHRRGDVRGAGRLPAGPGVAGRPGDHGGGGPGAAQRQLETGARIRLLCRRGGRCGGGSRHASRPGGPGRWRCRPVVAGGWGQLGAGEQRQLPAAAPPACWPGPPGWPC